MAAKLFSAKVAEETFFIAGIHLANAGRRKAFELNFPKKVFEQKVFEQKVFGKRAPLIRDADRSAMAGVEILG